MSIKQIFFPSSFSLVGITQFRMLELLHPLRFITGKLACVSKPPWLPHLQAKEIEVLREALGATGSKTIEEEVVRLRAELLRKEHEAGRARAALATEKAERERAQKQVGCRFWGHGILQFWKYCLATKLRTMVKEVEAGSMPLMGAACKSNLIASCYSLPPRAFFLPLQIESMATLMLGKSNGQAGGPCTAPLLIAEQENRRQTWCPGMGKAACVWAAMNAGSRVRAFSLRPRKWGFQFPHQHRCRQPQAPPGVQHGH
jgi:hypothetical protein